ncbi:TPA: transcription elongation factor GreA [Candidatus Saccharibacteria bacterium]|nr:transcription elongation factor GreA [Candidatus Saccharibacteria bacterium]HRK41341.1 transcription elongation factor GreA [Candidatus Saccharibacteria bacterium]
MKKQYHLTTEGKTELEAELAELIAKRSEIAEKIANARDYGDLSENAEYDAAREEQAMLESRIAELEDILKNADIIKPTKSSTIKVGSTVHLENGKKVTYKVVGPVEADPLEGKISNESPIGAALMGKKVGDKVSIVTPKGHVEYSIEAVG